MEKQNIVFLLGNVVDKKEYASINDAVLKDKDIRHLLRTGFFWYSGKDYRNNCGLYNDVL